MASRIRRLVSPETMRREMALAKQKMGTIPKRLADSTAGTLRNRLKAIYVINQAMMFAAILLLTLFPLLT